jgi:hypothetical protein
MSTYFIGTTFAPNSQWHNDEKNLIQSIQNQIDQHFANKKNLFINTTWFGPQFPNGQYQKFESLVEKHEEFDNVFLLAAPDPVYLNHDQILQLANSVKSTKTFLLGNFDSPYNFNFIGSVLPKYFEAYSDHDLMLQKAKYIFINYNRKPRDHRIQMVNKLFKNNLQALGIITLGENNNIYNRQNLSLHPLNLNETPNEGNWGMSMEFGIPHDIHTLGNINLWQNCFLNVVGETEFLPWDNTFVTEKTWKPIIGMRPFVINGQTKIYSWLRTHGFRTFNHFWPHIKMEDLTEFEVHDSIVAVIKYLVTQDLNKMYQHMLPDLQHNRDRYFEFAQEQKFRMNNLFE